MTDLDDDRLVLPPGPDVPLDLSHLERRVAGRRTRRRIGAGAVGVLLVVAGVVVATQAGDDAQTAPSVPSPLFDEVEQLTPTQLPAGWARCGGGPSDRQDAKDGWWAQTFGPVVDDVCQPLVTVTQIPSGDPIRLPKGRTNGGIGVEPGRTGAQHWSDEQEGSRGLYTSLSGQKLVVEACCGPEATDDEVFLAVANAARDGSREVEPARCTAPESDLSQESFIENFFGRRTRLYDEGGCPIRTDIAELTDEGPDAHCYAGVSFLAFGTPFGASMDSSEKRLYTRERYGTHGAVNPLLDLDAAVPATAVDTGYSKDGRRLWIDEADDERIYVVFDDGHVEAWPRDREMHMCA